VKDVRNIVAFIERARLALAPAPPLREKVAAPRRDEG
jgi:hypothetical protein